jgi:hypothetical protein
MQPHDYRQRHLKWAGLELRLPTGRLLATVKSTDDKYPGMYRVHMPDGHVTDMVNLTRAKDAAVGLALARLQRPVREPRTASLASQSS